jgi:hypothetical protein
MTKNSHKGQVGNQKEVGPGKGIKIRSNQPLQPLRHGKDQRKAEGNKSLTQEKPGKSPETPIKGREKHGKERNKDTGG